jgi:hypothetical protein
LKGRHFDDTDDIRINTTAALKAVPQNSSKFVLKGELGAGIGAQLPYWSTLKAAIVIFSNEVCNTSTAMSSRTLLSDQIYVDHYTIYDEPFLSKLLNVNIPFV